MDDSGVDLKSSPSGQLGTTVVNKTPSPKQQETNDNNDNNNNNGIPEKQPLADTHNDEDHGKHQPPRPLTLRNVLTVIILILINLVNYIDRYTTAAVVGRLKIAFDISDQLAGLIQTCFIISYMITSPLFGYLGDRYTRRYIMSFGLVLWASIGLGSSFVPESSYILLLVSRALIGVGEAAYTNLCPSIISDMFVGQARTLVLTIYQFAVPLGCGVGYMMAAAVAEAFDSWRWAYRITPPIIVLLAIVLAAYVREPPRGHAEGATHLTNTGFRKDIRSILSTRSFMLTSFAFTCVAFALGALSYWTVNLVGRSYIMNKIPFSESDVGFKFGLITIAAGVGGVAVGVIVSNKILKPRIGPRADTLVCGVGMLIAAPSIFGALICVENYLMLAWVLMFLGIAALCCCWVLVIDITMTIIIATRRATAEAVQMTIGHLFGDAASPYIVGIISDHLKKSGEVGEMTEFRAMQQALYLPTFIVVLSGCLFLFASLYINEDADNAKKVSQKGAASTGKKAVENGEHHEMEDLLAAASFLPLESEAAENADVPPATVKSDEVATRAENVA